MTRFVATADTPLPADEAFAFMSDLRLFPSWDPSIVRATQVAGNGPGPDAIVDLSFGVGVGVVTLRYRMTTYSPPHALVFEARNRWLSSYDAVTVEAVGEGSRVTYDAQPTLHAPRAVEALVLGAPFRVLGAMAQAGLRSALTPARPDVP